MSPHPEPHLAGGAQPTRAASTLNRSWGEPALAAENLTKCFGDRVAFEDVSFEVGYREVFGFLGPNGSGKTTTVRSWGTLPAPSARSARVHGRS